MTTNAFLQSTHLRPKNTTVIILSFEGPDPYSLAGGLGVRVKELSLALARLHYETHLFFVGDFAREGHEILEGGFLHLHRWCQWLSRHHPLGVYDNEESKVEDWTRTLPAAVVGLALECLAAGKTPLIMAEEWHTAESVREISSLLYASGARSRCILLWNANNTFGLERINLGVLGFASTITTVSRYMKVRMWPYGVNPMVIPNGIPRELTQALPIGEIRALRVAARADLLLSKIARFDPDKRWLMAIAAVGALKRSGVKVKLIMRGGAEPHGHEVMAEINRQRLVLATAPAPTNRDELKSLLESVPNVDVLCLTSLVYSSVLRGIYGSSDAVLANSSHEPFGLVGLEVMAAGGIPVVGGTGEDYAEPYRNALVVESEDPIELANELLLLKDRPRLAELLRHQGRQTAQRFVWEAVIGQLFLAAEAAGARQHVKLTRAK